MKKISEKKAARIFRLIEERTRCLVLARHGYIGVNAWGNYFNKAIQLDDRINEELFGTSDLVELGNRWGMLRPPPQAGKSSSTEKGNIPKKKVFVRKRKKKRGLSGIAFGDEQ